jgi:hypothetical protein
MSFAFVAVQNFAETSFDSSFETFGALIPFTDIDKVDTLLFF